MDVEMTLFPSGIGIITTVISLLLIGVGIYLLFLLVKALRIYIKKNS